MSRIDDSNLSMMMSRSSISAGNKTNLYDIAQAIALGQQTAITERHQKTLSIPSLLVTMCRDADCKTAEDITLQRYQSNELIMEISRLKSALARQSSLEQQNRVLTVRCRQSEVERDRIFDKILQLQRQMRDDCMRQEEKLEEAYKKIKILHETNCQLQRQVQSTKFQQRNYETEKEIVECRAKLTLQEAEIRNKQEQMSKMAAEHKELKEQSQSTVTEFRNKIQAAEETYKIIKGELSIKMAEVHQKTEQIQKMASQLSCFTGIQQQLTNLKDIISKRESSFDEERNRLIESISMTRSDKAKWQKMARDAQVRTVQLQKQLKNNEIQQRQLQTITKTAELKKHEIEHQYSLLQQNQQNLKRQLSQSLTRNHELQVERQQYLSQLQTLQHELEMERKKIRKLQLEVAGYAEQSALHLKIEVENRLLKDQVQKLYQSNLEKDREGRERENRERQNRQRENQRLALEEQKYSENYEEIRYGKIESTKRACSLDRRKQQNYWEKENRTPIGIMTPTPSFSTNLPTSYVSNPPSVERPASMGRQSSHSRLDTINSQRPISDYTDPFVCEDGRLLRNKLSEKNLLPESNRQPKLHRGGYGQVRAIHERQKMNESILKRCQMLLNANRVGRV